jgi:hypothetical protein
MKSKTHTTFTPIKKTDVEDNYPVIIEVGKDYAKVKEGKKITKHSFRQGCERLEVKERL